MHVALCLVVCTDDHRLVISGRCTCVCILVSLMPGICYVSHERVFLRHIDAVVQVWYDTGIVSMEACQGQCLSIAEPRVCAVKYYGSLSLACDGLMVLLCLGEGGCARR